MERTSNRLIALCAAIATLFLLAVISCSTTSAQEQPEEPKVKPPVEKPQSDKKKQADEETPKPAEDVKNERETKENAEEKSQPVEKKEEKEEKKEEDKKEEEKPPKFTKEQIKKTYPVGERLTYNISWKGIHAGTAVLEVNAKVRYKGRQCFRIRSYANSAKAISLFYKVQDKMQTYVDAETLEPLRSDQKMKEGSHRRELYVIYTPKDRTAEYFKKKNKKFVSRVKHKKVPYAIQDSLSALYFLRTMNLELEKSYEMKILTGRRITKGMFQITEKKELKIKGVGTFTALKITPKYIEVPGQGKLKPGEGLFVASGDSEVWLDEKTGIPLLMYVDIPLGSIRVRLSKKETIVDKKKKEK